jgi:hypothetical protein
MNALIPQTTSYGTLELNRDDGNAQTHIMHKYATRDPSGQELKG